jgi:hypothetical protein
MEKNQGVLEHSLSITIPEDVTMEDVRKIMREEDAQLLESMHFEHQSCDVDADFDSNEHLDNSDQDEVLIHENDLDEPQRHGFSKQAEPICRAPSVTSEKDISVNDKENEVVYRQCLSGEIKSFRSSTQSLTSDVKPESSNDADPDKEETATASTSCSLEISNSPTKTVSTESGSVAEGQRKHNRTSSSNRRINEAVQFAEAVGEMPPLDSNELRIIEEAVDDDTDEEDGNATVIRVGDTAPRMGSIHEILEVTTQNTAAAESQQEAASEEGGMADPLSTPSALVRRRSRPQWPLQLPGWTFSQIDTSTHKHLETSAEDYVYKGIHSNPPEIVKRGMARGNHVQLHRKAWLEVSDKYHRYGKNLRLYYRYWESLGYPTNMFFDWLDSKGEAAGFPLPNLDECPRSMLDSDSVLYITNPDVTAGYALKIVTEEGRARLIDVDGELVKTGPDGWIFVLRDGVIYGAEKITSISGQSKQRFHHSSFFGGKAVAAAGIIITNDDGILVRLYPHSGHYRPREAHMQRLLYFLYHEGVDLRTFEMDTQQIMHVARDTGPPEKIKCPKSDKSEKNNLSKLEKKETEKKKKVDSLMLMPAITVACFVAHKAHFIGEGIFSQIRQIRTAKVTSVTEAVDHLNKNKRPSTPRPLASCGAAAD